MVSYRTKRFLFYREPTMTEKSKDVFWGFVILIALIAVGFSIGWLCFGHSQTVIIKESNAMGDLIKIGGLWTSSKEDKNGNKFLSGTFGYGAKILIFKNVYKKPGSNEPDWNMFIAPGKDAQSESSGDEERRDLKKDAIDPDDTPF